MNLKIWGVGGYGGVRGGVGKFPGNFWEISREVMVSGNFREIAGKFPGFSWIFPDDLGDDRELQHDIK